MGRLSASLISLALGVLAAVVLASCGGSGADLLPGETAQEIKENLDRVEQLANEGDCVGAEDATAEIVAQVEELQVDVRLQEALSKGVLLLSEVVTECQEEGEEETTDTVETAPAPEAENEKTGKSKPAKEPEEETEPEEEAEGGEETGEAPSTEPEEAPSGGVGPGAPAEGE